MNCAFIMDNGKINKTERVISLIKENNLVLFTFPLYSPELNIMENTFGRFKTRISFNNLNWKDFKNVIINKISKH